MVPGRRDRGGSAGASAGDSPVSTVNCAEMEEQGSRRVTQYISSRCESATGGEGWAPLTRGQDACKQAGHTEDETARSQSWAKQDTGECGQVIQ